MTMTASEPGTGIFHAVVRTAEGRVVEYDGDADEIDFWLSEFRKADTLAEVDVRELTDDELEAHGPIWDSQGSSEEDDEAPVDDDE
jgi:hypothetical protein